MTQPNDGSTQLPLNDNLLPAKAGTLNACKLCAYSHESWQPARSLLCGAPISQHHTVELTVNAAWGYSLAAQRWIHKSWNQL